MAYRYEVVTVRLEKGAGYVDRSFQHETEAIEYLASLADDDDCLLAEIQRWPFISYPYSESDIAGQPEPILLVAQYHRIDGEWQRAEGDLRCKSIGSEARNLLYDASL